MRAKTTPMTGFEANSLATAEGRSAHIKNA